MEERLQDLSNKDIPHYNWGHGSGALGLPGDTTSPSRFARLAFAKEYAKKPKSAEEGVLTTFHVLNGFDIVKGTVVFPQEDSGVSDEYTQWTVVYDLNSQVGFYKTYKDQEIKRIKINLQGKATTNSLPWLWVVLLCLIVALCLTLRSSWI